MNLRIPLSIALSLAPAMLLARTVPPGPPAGRTGLEADGGLTCAACHRAADGSTTANADPRARLIITAANYTVGARQKVSVRVEHPEAVRWGFQITARLESDPTKAAGTFIGNDTVFVRCGMDNTIAAIKQNSCNGDIEFVNHTPDSTTAGSPGGHTWEFEWEATAGLTGKVLFSAAGNAANNGGTNQGDNIVTSTLTIEAAGTRPSISTRGVADPFSFTNTISSQSWFAITGTNLASATRAWTQDTAGPRLPTTLSGVSVTVNNMPAAIFYVSPTQINALSPLDSATGMVPVVVTNAAGVSEPMMVMKAAAAPAFFAPAAQGGRYYARGMAADGTWVGKTGVDIDARRGARPGETITLFGTGFGAPSTAVPADTLPTAPVTLAVKPTIRLGETSLTFPGNGVLALPGLYRFDVTIPAGTADGDIALTAETGGARSASTVFLTVAR